MKKFWGTEIKISSLKFKIIIVEDGRCKLETRELIISYIKLNALWSGIYFVKEYKEEYSSM
jgi:hypothetical protein